MPIDFPTVKYADPAAFTPASPAATDAVMARTSAGADRSFLLGNLAGIAGLTASADLSLYYNGTAWATYTVTSVGRTLLAATTQAAQRTALGAADDTAVVHLTGNEPVGGIKTFTGAQVRIQSTVPGFWLDETDGSYSTYIVHDANQLLIQCRNSGFGSLVDVPIQINYGATSADKSISTLYNFRPRTDNSVDLGTGALRFRTYYGVNSAINTSDARLKTEPRQLSEAERKAGSALARLPAIWEWLTGDRLHAGPTVQAAMAVMAAHELDPFAYSFVCYDEWEAEPEKWQEWEEEQDDEGNIVREAGRELIQAAREAGDRYSFRKEELLCFMLSSLAAENDAQAAQVEALDARLAALEART